MSNIQAVLFPLTYTTKQINNYNGGCGAILQVPAPDPTIPPRPPCSYGYQRKNVVVSMDAVWRFLVTAAKH